MTYENFTGKAAFNIEISKLNEKYKDTLKDDDRIDKHFIILNASDGIYFEFIDELLPQFLMDEIEQAFHTFYMSK